MQQLIHLKNRINNSSRVKHLFYSFQDFRFSNSIKVINVNVRLVNFSSIGV